MFNLGDFPMKKTLVAMAAFAAVSSFAQSTVTLYGIADAWFGSEKTGVGAASVSNTKVDSGGLSGSRWGLRGSEDLGGGLKANFTAESGFDISTGISQQQGRLMGRQAFVGLSGGFGEVRLGRQYTAYDVFRSTMDTFGHSSFSTTATNGSWTAFGRDYTFRVDNAINYSTPNFSGFSAAFTYGLGENKVSSTSEVASITSLHVLYANGPITAGLAYQQEKAGTGVVGNLAGNLTSQGVGYRAGATKETHTYLAGAYDLGVAKINVGYNTSDDNAAAKIGKDKEWTVGANIPFGAMSLGVSYGSSKNDTGKSGTFGLQGIYSLSKRTDTYVGFTDGKNEDAAGVDTRKYRVFAVGMRHRF
jgi:predicted porin